MTTIKIKPENIHLVHELVALNERTRKEHAEIHARAERQCAALGESTKAEMTALFLRIGAAEGIVNMDVPDYCVETKYLDEHGLAFLTDGMRQNGVASLLEATAEDEPLATVMPTSHRKH